MNLKSSEKNVLQSTGYLFLPRFLLGRKGHEVADSVGDVLPLGVGGGVHELTPLRKDQAPPNTYSGIYGHEAFPFHTDLAHWQDPPRYLMLRCLRGFREVPTLLLDGLDIAEAMGKTTLRRALVRPRRPVGGSLRLLRLLDEREEGPLLRWDEVFILAASDQGKSGIEKLRVTLREQPAIKIFLVDEGDTLFVDNWRMLHARSPVPAGCVGRSIERAYLGRLL